MARHQSLAPEEWRAIQGFPHEVSNFGRVRRGPRLMKLGISPKGYERVSLWVGNAKRDAFVHRLVAEAFIGPCPVGKFVNHINGLKRRNWVWNLEYVTPRENTHHAMRIGIRIGRPHGAKDISPRVRRWGKRPTKREDLIAAFPGIAF